MKPEIKQIKFFPILPSLIFLLAGCSNGGNREEQVIPYGCTPGQDPQPAIVCPYGSVDENLLITSKTSTSKILVLPHGSRVEGNKIILPYGNKAEVINKRSYLIHNTNPTTLKEDVSNFLVQAQQQTPNLNRFVILHPNSVGNIGIVSIPKDTYDYRQEKYPPKFPPRTFYFWDGLSEEVDFPQDVWQNIIDAAMWINNNSWNDKSMHIASILFGIRATENKFGNKMIPVNPSSGACGPFQFLPGTWEMVKPIFDENIKENGEVEGFTDDCLNEKDSAFMAAAMVVDFLKLTEQPTEEEFVECFFEGCEDSKGYIWNRHRGHAQAVWRIAREIYNWLSYYSSQDRETKPMRKEGVKSKISVNPEVSVTEAISKIESLLGIPYKNFGYRDDKGNDGYLYGSPENFIIDNYPGLNCAGFLIEAMRSVFGNFQLNDVIKPRTDRQGSQNPDGDWLWYGYDLVKNLGDKFQGKEFIIDQIGWTPGIGYPMGILKNVVPHMKIGNIYLGSINIENHQEGRMHHHVIIILPTAEGIKVYESISPQAQKKDLIEFIAGRKNPNESVYIVEIPLP